MPSLGQKTFVRFVSFTTRPPTSISASFTSRGMSTDAGMRAGASARVRRAG